ncbi:MAG: tetratricopeptide repeat protein [Bryobacteraceae bacterium]
MRFPWPAIVFCCAALAQAPTPEQIFHDAIAAQQRGDDAAAIAKYQQLVKLRPEVMEVRANLGAALAHAGRYDEAIEQYRVALAKLPNNKGLRLNLALAYYKKGDLPQAAEKLESLRQADSADVRIATLLGDCYARLGRDQDAIAALTPAEAAHPDDLNIAWALGSALIHAGNPTEGLKRVVMVAQQGHSAEANLLAAETYLAMSEFEPAHVFADEALRLNPKLKGVYSLSGRIKQYLGDFPGAKADLDKAFAENPTDFDAHVTMAAILNLERDLDGAELHAKRALELMPASPLARYQLARVQRSRGDIEGAVLNFEKVIAAEPDWLRPHIELASLYYRLHREDDGQKERAIVDKLYMQGKKQGPDADK